jgi:hypothetical protein
MKKIYTLIFLLFAIAAHAAPVNTALGNNGSWHSASNWSLGRLPVAGDTVVIPSGKTILVQNTHNYGSGTLILKVYGTMKLTGRLEMGSASKLVIYGGGRLDGSGSNADRIRIGNNTVFKGGDDPVSGPAVATASSSDFDSFANSPLPVKFVGFSVARSSADVLIQWSTSEEVNASVYEVEKSLDGASWSAIAYVMAAGNTATLTNYSFTDRNVAARVVYYRIKQVDTDGRFSYTAVRSLRSEVAPAASDIRIAGAQSKVVLQFPSAVYGNVLVRIVSLSGQVLAEQRLQQAVGQVILPTTLKGNYVVALSNGRELNVARQVIL